MASTLMLLIAATALLASSATAISCTEKDLVRPPFKKAGAPHNYDCPHPSPVGKAGTGTEAQKPCYLLDLSNKGITHINSTTLATCAATLDADKKARVTVLLLKDEPGDRHNDGAVQAKARHGDLHRAWAGSARASGSACGSN